MADRLEVIRRLEEVGLATWPALEIERHHGWDLRAAGGVTKRSNSVSPLRSSPLPLDETITCCERWYSLRGLPTSFRLTELADPDLEPALEARGYVLDPYVDVMTRRIAHPTVSPDVELDDQPTAAWLDCLIENRFEPGTPPSVVVAMLEARNPRTVFASIHEGGTIVAHGIGVVHDEHAAVYAMHTVDGYRRRGLGTRLLDGLLAWGATRGACTAFLQVHSETPGAHAMYARVGFETMYRYWYRAQPA